MNQVTANAESFIKWDTNQDGVLNEEELKANGQSLSMWNIDDTDGQHVVTQTEFLTRLSTNETLQDHQTDVIEPHSNSKGPDTTYENQTNFTADDFSQIDTGGDGFISREEWLNAGLDEGLFDYIAGDKGVISQDNFTDYLAAQDAAPNPK